MPRASRRFSPAARMQSRCAAQWFPAPHCYIAACSCSCCPGMPWEQPTPYGHPRAASKPLAPSDRRRTWLGIMRNTVRGRRCMLDWRRAPGAGGESMPRPEEKGDAAAAGLFQSSLALPSRRCAHRAIDVRSLLPSKSKPAQVFEHRRGKAWARSLRVHILVAQDEHTRSSSRPRHSGGKCPRVPKVQKACRRARQATAV